MLTITLIILFVSILLNIFLFIKFTKVKNVWFFYKVREHIMNKYVYSNDLNEKGNLEVKKLYFNAFTQKIDEKENEILTVKMEKDIADVLQKADFEPNEFKYLKKEYSK